MTAGVLVLGAAGLALVAASIRALRSRLLLSRAKHPSLDGHSRLARRLAKLVPFYEYGDDQVFRSDGAPDEVEARRRLGFQRLSQRLQARAPNTIALSEDLESAISDLSFTTTYRVPFQYARYVKDHLKVGALAQAASGVLVTDLDGNADFDLSGSYGTNVFGYDFYKACIEAGVARVRSLGPVLGTYHPVIVENVHRLKAISGLDEVSFHMSGTEAVMQAVQLARYHTGRTHLVRFCGAYHGWWDGVQPGVGNPRHIGDVYTLKDMDDAALRVLRGRHDIACVLVNPLQALHPNRRAPGDSTLINSSRRAHLDRAAYTRWLEQLREVCTARSIVLILDEVFVGFRIAYGGAQEYFGVAADMVTYGKTLGGGLPVGVLCGKRQLMKRFNDERPSDICFARGTFNSHPYVMGAMNEFLRRVNEPALRDSYRSLDETWDARAAALNNRFESEDLSVRVANLSSIWTVFYTAPSRYNWMFQYYLRAEGLILSWIGTGRLIFSHNYADADFEAVADRMVAAARKMRQDGWWWQTPALTDAAIARQVLHEVVAARLTWRGPGRARGWSHGVGLTDRVEELPAEQVER